MANNVENLRLSVVIPVYNESKTVRRVIEEVGKQKLVSEIIVIDDCSKDGTKDILDEIAREHKSKASKVILKVIYNENNLGKGGALEMGFSQISNSIAIIQDADLEYLPSDYDKLISAFSEKKVDAIYGSRFYFASITSTHIFLNKLITFISNISTGLHLHDMATCYKLCRAEFFKNLRISSRRFGIEPEITAKLAYGGYKIYETPITYKARTYEEGKKRRLIDGIEIIVISIKELLIHLFLK